MKKREKNGIWLMGLLCAACVLWGCGDGGETLLEAAGTDAAVGQPEEAVTGATVYDGMQASEEESVQTAPDPGQEQQAMPGAEQGQQAMPDPGQGQQAMPAAEQDQQAMPDSGQMQQTEQSGLCYVYVCGAVAQPGVYEVPDGTRLCDVLACAGGITADGEETSFNQAAAVYDGMMVLVPTREEWTRGAYVQGADGLPVRAQDADVQTMQEAGTDAAGVQGNAADRAQPDGLVNINEADAEQLCTLPGVGSARAASIIAYRQEHGGFRSIEEIKNVSGIKNALFEKIKTKIKV